MLAGRRFSSLSVSIRPAGRLIAVGMLLAGVLANPVAAQDYILNAGPRGFDPGLNRYGATRQKPRTPPSRDGRFDPARTTLHVEILSTERGGALDAQRWSRAISEMGYSVRTHSSRREPRPKVEESSQGPLRTVTVVGVLDSRGQVHFPKRSYSLSQIEQIRQWLEEIKMYGAQGAPDGQPMWGLNQAQFEALYGALGTIVRQETQGMPLKRAIARLGLPAEYPVTFSRDAERRIQQSGELVVGSVKGLSAGTSLAYLLSEQGLGFQPRRMPQGRIELHVEPLPDSPPPPTVGGEETTPTFWPVGWELSEPDDESPTGDDKPETLPLRMQIAPKYFKTTRFGLPNATLAEALAASTRETGVPALVSQPDLARAGIDPQTTRIELPHRFQSWRTAMTRITSSVHLRSDLRRDEVGNPLMWITGFGR